MSKYKHHDIDLMLKTVLIHGGFVWWADVTIEELEKEHWFNKNKIKLTNLCNGVEFSRNKEI